MQARSVLHKRAVFTYINMFTKSLQSFKCAKVNWTIHKPVCMIERISPSPSNGQETHASLGGIPRASSRDQLVKWTRVSGSKVVCRSLLTKTCQVNSDQLRYIACVQLRFSKERWPPGTLPQSDRIVWLLVDAERCPGDSQALTFEVPLETAFTSSVEGTIAIMGEQGFKDHLEAVLAIRQTARQAGKEMILMIIMPRQLRVYAITQFLIEVE